MYSKKSTGLTIRRSPAYKSVSLLSSLALVVALMLSAAKTTPVAHAVTPPESCFGFDAINGMIDEYYFTENNDPESPDCPLAVDIPSSIGGVPVTGFDEWAFENHGLTSVSIPNTVTSIDDGVFGYNNLTSVTLPDSLTTINEYAFINNQLTSITIPEGVTSIGEQAFARNLLTNASLPISLTSIGDEAFYKNELASVNLPTNLTSIGIMAFYENKLTSITIPGSVTNLGDYAFYGNQLTTATITSGVADMGEGAFSHNQLTSITIPGSVTLIGNFAFKHNNLTSVTILDGVTDISDDVFSDNQLTSVSLPNSLMSIGDSAFSSNNLTSVTIPSGVTSIGVSAFTHNDLTHVTIPSSVIYISDRAFRFNQLTSVTIPSGVTSIGDEAFAINQLTSVVVPSGVTYIGDYAFFGNQLTSATIPSSVTTIGDHAFEYNRLDRLSIPAGITSVIPYILFGQSRWGGDVRISSNADRYQYSNDPVVVQNVYNNFWYSRVYSSDGTSPQQLQDFAISEAYDAGSDKNQNGTQNESIGGHIINPATTVIRYRDTNGNSIAPDVTVTGLKTGMSPSSSLDSSDYLHSYLVVESGISAPLDSYSPTPEELTTMQTGFDQYYRLGDSVTFGAKNISGYITPAPATVTLNDADTIATLTYKPFVTSVPFVSGVVADGAFTNAQPPVGVHVPTMAQSTLTITGSGGDPSDCSRVESANLLAPAVIPTGDLPSGIAVLGGLEFSLVCSSGGQTGIDFTLGTAVPDATKLLVYKYGLTTQQLTDITDQVSITSRTIDGKLKTVVSYTLVDGGALDEDGTANGTIEDPLVIGYEGILPSDTGDDTLAETGVSFWMMLAASAAALLLGGGVLFKLKGSE